MKNHLINDKANFPQLVTVKAVSGVTAAIDLGAVIVRDESGKEIRLSWDKNGQAGEVRPLKPGKYTIVGYREEKKTDDGIEWMITASSTNFAQFVVEAGKTIEIPVPKKILQSGKLHAARGGGNQVMMALSYGKGGVTIYRDGKRIPMPFRVFDSSGRVVGEGKIEYG